ncbi:MAG TPA: GNAT family N-acetyltransferase, partial [Gemmataceae bacterium]|nr:GNAT family N-acetyltransferase [Gemmataceae bacterium]
SALNTDLVHEDPRLPEVARRLAERGISIHTLDPSRYEQELKRVYDLSLASFHDNFLFTPLGEAEFAEQYAAVRPYLRPDLFILAKCAGDLVGYFFCLPDLNQVKRGVPVDTVLLKTMAVHPDHGGMGLGGLLMGRAHEAARQAGFRRAIHALMHETNRSGKISGHTARVFRRYTLFAKPLGGRP